MISLSRLPTELDEHILEHCDQLSLSRISRTSTYYRRITEPFLYRDIKLNMLNPTAVESLCLNLVNRKPRAQHVQSLSLFKRSRVILPITSRGNLHLLPRPHPIPRNRSNHPPHIHSAPPTTPNVPKPNPQSPPPNRPHHSPAPSAHQLCTPRHDPAHTQSRNSHRVTQPASELEWLMHAA